MNLRLLWPIQLLLITFALNVSAGATPYGIRGDIVPDTDASLEKEMKEQRKNQGARLAHPVRRIPEVKRENIKVISAWCKPSIGNNPNSACYITIHNTHEQPIEIRGISVYPSSKDIHFPVAKLVEFRTMVRDADGKSRTVPIGKASIPADEKLVMTPGQNHLHLGSLRQKMEIGKNVFMHVHIRYLDGPLEVEASISHKEPK